MTGLAAGAGLGTVAASAQSGSPGPRQVERLDRGVVAIERESDVLVRWRLFGTDPEDVAFHCYRDGERVTDDPIQGSTNLVDPDGSAGDEYAVAPVVDGSVGERSDPVEAWAQNYLDVPLNRPGDEYHPNDCSVGDLTGDGSYDVVVKWVGASEDNAHDGYTDPNVFDAYTLDGEHLWRIDLGINVRAGAHYAQPLVYDFDGDGIAEFVVRTADGTVDGAGNVIGDPDADWRNDAGRILEGPEYLTVFDGSTGEEIVTTDFEPARGDVCQWGDCYGNRADRFLAGVAYLDGERPSIVQARGYYEKTMLAAYDFRDGELSLRWIFDSDDPGNGGYAGQGAHSLSVADVDGDGYDEIVYGAAVIDHDGTGLHTTGWNHGDALHVGDFVPSRDGQEIFMPHEWGEYGATMRDAETGEQLWAVPSDEDVGRGVAGNVDPTRPGAEAWASSGIGLREGGSGERIGDAPGPKNFLVWWSGDLKREFLDDTWIGEWDPAAQSSSTVVDFRDVASNNGSKATPCLSGDILGDWREEVLLRRSDDEALRLFVTPHETEHRLPTFAHDTQYRTAIAWQNVGYNQPPHPSFFVGDGMELPEYDVQPVGGDVDPCEGAEPTPIDPYLRVGDGDEWSDWENVGEVTIEAGQSVELGPHPTDGGSWHWDGPGLSSTSREVVVTPEESATYTVTHANDCDVESTYEFVVTVDGSAACADAAGGSLEVDGQTVCNVDGDPYFRDVNGDGAVGNRDVGAFFQRFHLDAWDREEFDFSGNGRVSHGDVVALFDAVT